MSEKIIIEFKDSNLVSELIRIFNKRITKISELKIEIEKSLLTDTKELNLNGLYISQLNGLENFSSLTSLSLSNNGFSDISPLSNLKLLKTLRINGNNFSEISALKNLINLEYLDISRNPLNDDSFSEDNGILSEISKITNLKYLNASWSLIKYLKGLQNLTKLEYLNLYENLITDISYLRNLKNLATLYLGYNKISTNESVEILNNLVNLQFLDMSNNDSRYIVKNISKLINLEVLRLEGNSIYDITDLKYLTKLKKLILYGNYISNVSSLTNLTILEELNLSGNKLTDINILYNPENKQLTLPLLKKFSIAKNYLDTTKNKEILDFLISKTKKNEIELDYHYSIFDTSKLPKKDSNGTYITYSDFGAKGNGIYDDFISIKYAHEFANEHNCEVRGVSGFTYHIFKYYDETQVVKTNVNWNNAKFIIHDENIEYYRSRRLHLFRFNNYNPDDVISIDNPKFTINKKTKKIIEIKSELDTLKNKGYKTFFIHAINNDHKIYYEGGSLQDFFIIDSEGKVLYDIQYDFEKLSSFKIFPIPNNKLIVKNGNFLYKVIETQSGIPTIRSGLGKDVVISRALNFSYSFNTEISGIINNLEKDVIAGSYSGQIGIEYSAHIKIFNCKVFSRPYVNYWRNSSGFGAHYSVDLFVKNMYMDDYINSKKWGVMSSNYLKYSTFESVIMSRIDSHQGMYNLNVLNSNIGMNGLSLIGQGEVNIINSTFHSPYFIELRRGEGSSWDGNLNIINSTLIPVNSAKIIIYGFTYDSNGKLKNFGYDPKYPNIYISNLIVDNRELSWKTYPFVIYNDQNNERWRVTDENKKYFNKSNIVIDKINFVNTNFNLGGSIISYYPIENFNRNVFISDLEFIFSNKNIGSDLFFNKSITLQDDLHFIINKSSLSNNTIKIYKDNEVTHNFMVENYTDIIFNNNGKYKIWIDSVESKFKYKGSIEYAFNIQKNSSSVGFAITFIILIIIFIIVGGFFYLRYKRKRKNESILGGLFQKLSI